MRSRWLTVLPALLAVAAGSAQADPQATADAVDAAIVSWMSANRIQSAAVAVGRHGNLVASYGHGGWTAGQPHPIASLSKAITAVCVGRLLDSGKLSLGQDLDQAIGREIGNSGGARDPQFGTITIAQLLTHRAGLRRDNFGDARTVGDAFRNIIRVDLEWRPGSGFHYSNNGYLILGYIAQIYHGKPYHAACDPLADFAGESATIEPTLKERAPNGGWKMSAIGYLKFLGHFDPATDRMGPVAKSFLQAPTEVGNYSLGAWFRKSSLGTRYWHDGVVYHDRTRHLGGASYYVVDENGYAVVVLYSNLIYDRDAIARISKSLKAAIDQALATDPGEPRRRPLSAPESTGPIGE